MDAKKPEFIYVDEPEQSFEEHRMMSALGELHRIRYPVGLRVLAFFGSFICLILGLCVLAATCVWFLAAALLLFRSSTLNDSLKKSRRLTAKLFVLFNGLLVAVFDPSFGFGMIVLYFVVNGENMNQKFFTAIIRPDN